MNIVFFSSRFGYVDFTSPDEAKEYLKMNGMEFRGQHLNVDLATNKQRQCKMCVCANKILVVNCKLH